MPKFVKNIFLLLLCITCSFLKAQTHPSQTKTLPVATQSQGKNQGASTQNLVMNLLRDTCLDKKFSIAFYLINDSAFALPNTSPTLTMLFEEQVKGNAEKIALSMGDQCLTYDELNRRANQLARQLLSLGAKQGDLIGVCLERSPLLIVALLGVQKIGAAYVPIDPDYPSLRVAYMIEDSRARILIADGSNARDIDSQDSKYQVLGLDINTLDTFSAGNLDCPLSPELPAYVIYTSGSTGNPKGVQISQGALVNFLLTMSDQPGISSTDRLLTVTTISFDIAGLEIYLPLISGAEVVMVDRSIASDGAQLLHAIEKHSATILQATPITWRLLLAAGWNGNGLNQIWCGGEAFPIDLANQLVQTPAKVWNLYGPTETTIWSTRYSPPNNDKLISSVPIGKPIGNTNIFIYILLITQQQISFIHSSC